MSAAPADMVRCGEWSTYRDTSVLLYTNGFTGKLPTLGRPIAAAISWTGTWWRSEVWSADHTVHEQLPTTRIPAAIMRRETSLCEDAEAWICGRYPHAFDDRPQPTTTDQ